MAYPLDELGNLVADYGGEIYEGYSGRGMYGASCFGIMCDDRDTVTRLRDAGEEAGFGRASHDNLGRGYIVYWPRLVVTDE